MFTFNRDYHDLEQVREWLPRFREVLAEIESAGQYRYNDSFRGRIPGIEGPCEETAIYLLQKLERAEENRLRIEQALADGCEPIETVDRIQKFSRVIVYDDQDRMRGPIWQEWEDARILPETNPNLCRVGEPSVVLPKGKRTHGHRVNGRKVLVKR